MSFMWVIWVGSNLVGLPALGATGFFLARKLVVALIKRKTDGISEASAILAERNVQVSRAFLCASILFFLADLWMLGVGMQEYGEPIPAFIALGTLVVVVALVLLLVAAYKDLSLTERAAEVAEKERGMQP